MKESTGKRLQKIMSERNLKQVDILLLCEPYCKKYGVKMAKNDLSQYINDKVQPRQDKLSILGMALNVSEAWLMGFDVPRSKQPAADLDDNHPTLSAEAYAIALAFEQAPEGIKDSVAKLLDVKRDTNSRLLKEA